MVAVRTAAVHIAATRMALAAHTSRDTVMAAVYIAAVCMAAVCMTAVCMAAGIASSTSNGHSTPANDDHDISRHGVGAETLTITGNTGM